MLLHIRYMLQALASYNAVAKMELICMSQCCLSGCTGAWGCQGIHTHKHAPIIRPWHLPPQTALRDEQLADPFHARYEGCLSKQQCQHGTAVEHPMPAHHSAGAPQACTPTDTQGGHILASKGSREHKFCCTSHELMIRSTLFTRLQHLFVVDQFSAHCKVPPHLVIALFVPSCPIRQQALKPS
jgi:hypothetical protein